MDDKLNGKIQKLLALGKSPNKSEAEAAMAKVVALMTEHNIKVSQIKEKKNYIKETKNENYRLPSEFNHICILLQEYFFVKIITTKTNSSTIVSFIGTKENVMVAEYIYNQLKNIFYSFWLEYRQETKAPTTAKHSYYHGLYLGLCAKFNNERSATEKQMGLVLVKDPELDDAVNSFFDKLKKSPTQKIILNKDAHDSGIEDAKHVQIKKGLADNKTEYIK